MQTELREARDYLETLTNCASDIVCAWEIVRHLADGVEGKNAEVHKQIAIRPRMFREIYDLTLDAVLLRLSILYKTGKNSYRNLPEFSQKIQGYGVKFIDFVAKDVIETVSAEQGFSDRVTIDLNVKVLAIEKATLADTIRSEVVKAEGLVAQIHTIRDKAIAHHDKVFLENPDKFYTDSGFNLKDTGDLVELTKQIVIQMQSLLNSTYFRWLDYGDLGLRDLPLLLSRLENN